MASLTKDPEKSSPDSLVGVQDIFETNPSFQLLIISNDAITPGSKGFELLQKVFGCSDLAASNPTALPSSDLPTFSSKQNSRIGIKHALTPSQAKAYLQSRIGKEGQQKAVQMIWYCISSEDQAAVPSSDLDFGFIPTLVLLLSSKMDLIETSLKLRLESKIENAIIGADPSDPHALSTLSFQCELAVASSPETRLLWVAAQRSNADEKISSSIKTGMKLFLASVTASAQPIPFVGGAANLAVLGTLQYNIVSIYNFRDPGKVLVSKTLQELFYDAVTGLPVKFLVSLVGLKWVSGLWESPQTARAVTKSIADLVILLDYLFLTHNTNATPLTHEDVKAAIKKYDKSGTRKKVHHELEGFVGTFGVWQSFQRKGCEENLRRVVGRYRMV